MRNHTLVLAAILLFTAGGASAQGRPALSVRAESWAIDSGHLVSAEYRTGLTLGVGAGGEAGTLRLAATFVPEGDVEPGWTTFTVEGEPDLRVGRALVLGLRLAAGALNMHVANRHRVIAGCRPEDLCMFEARGFESGWASLVGAALIAGVRVGGQTDVTAGYGGSRLLGGANADEALRTWSVGVQHRFR